jgi:hypothetical protein
MKLYNSLVERKIILKSIKHFIFSSFLYNPEIERESELNLNNMIGSNSFVQFKELY